MRATATVVTQNGRAASKVIGTMRATAAVATRSGRAESSVKDAMMAAAALLPNGIRVKAGSTEAAGLHHYLNVTPVEAQELVWLTPQVGIDYVVDTSTNLKWNII